METFEAASIAEEILEKRYTILKLVETLENKLLNPDVKKREEAVRNLTDVLLILPVDFLNELEVETLSRCKNFPSFGEQNVVKAIFKEHLVQSLVQADRLIVFTLLKYFLDEKLEGLKGLDAEFVIGFIQAVDGEKDPRNLVLIFDCFCRISSEFPLGPFAEDMFEIVACYFPVEFRAPNDDSLWITSDQLSKALNRCLTSNSAYVKFCFDLILEKCQENNTDERLEVLKLLACALNSFPPTANGDYGSNIWQELRKIAITSTKDAPENERLMLECVKALISSLTNLVSDTGRNSRLVSLIGQISKDCEHFLSNTEMQLHNVCNKILLAAAEAGGADVCLRLASNVFYLLMEKFQSVSSCSQEYGTYMLDWILKLKQFNKISEIVVLRSSFVVLLCDDILAKSDEKILSTGLQIASLLFNFDSSIFNESQIEKIFRICLDKFGNENNEDPSLKTYSVDFFRVLRSARFDLLKQWLDSSTLSSDLISDLRSNLIVDQETAEIFLPSLLEFDEDDSRAVDRLNAFVFNNRQNSELCGSVWLPVSLKIKDCVRKSDVKDIPVERRLEMLATFGDLLQDLYVCLDSKSESEMLDFWLDPLNNSKLLSNCWLNVCEKIISASSEQIVDRSLFLFDGALNLVNTLINRSCFDSCQRACLQSCAKYLASLLNKLPKGNALLDRLLTSYLNLLENQLEDPENLFVMFFGWATKALILRNYQPICNNCLSKLFALLNSNNSDQVEKALECILVDDLRFLSVRVKAKCTFLYKQRVFDEFVRLLTTGFHSCSESQWKRNYFRLLSVLLANSPREVQTPTEVEKLIPLLVNSVQCDDIGLLIPSVDSIDRLLSYRDSASKLNLHVHALTMRLSELARFKDDMILRLTSLRCLDKIARNVNSSILNPYRHHVLRALAKCVDDRKRVVRQEAVKCRNEWSVLT